MSIQLTVSDLRQYEYCARIPYFTHVLGLRRVRPTTFKMAEGLLEHEHVADLEERRSLRSYGLQRGERLFNVALNSNSLHLTGLLDMLILSDGEAIPVEFKNDLHNRIGSNHLRQLAAYSLMVEEKWKVPVRRVFVHFIPTRKSCEVAMTEEIKAKFLTQLQRARQMIEREALPDATSVHGRCQDCEFRNFCPDIW
ncbi:MAG TPA: CRISPR-associated protein Cas4 [Chloroflexia bacterium]|nr:CRISPR-associated protein Cas4 [Chloroflexia bacterium]